MESITDKIGGYMYKSIGHCRVSKGDPEEIKNSLNSQKSEIIKFASKELNINEDEIKWYIEDEARSAYSNRADWQKFEDVIQEACLNKDIKYFLDYSQERFCRDRIRSQIYKGILRRSNVTLRFVSGDIGDVDSLEGFILECINEMIAEMYSKKVGIDTLRGCKENARTRDRGTGYAFKNGGSARFWLKAKKIPIGQDKFGEDVKKTIWVENDTIHTAMLEGKIVSKTMWDWSKYYFLELRLNRQLSIEKARDILNELKIPAPRRNFWVTSSLYDAEKDTSLLGISTYNKRKFARDGKGRIKDQDEWIVVENAHPALLTREQFDALDDLRQAKRKRAGGSTIGQSYNEHLLTGQPDRFTCKSCGSKIISSGGVYTCGRYNTNGRKGCGAPSFSVKSQELEAYIFDIIEKATSEEEIKMLYDDLIKSYNNENSVEEKLKSLKKGLAEKEKAQSNLIKSLSSMTDMNEFAVKAITKELENVSREIELLKKEIEELSKPKLVKIPSFKEFQNQIYTGKSLLTHSNFHQKRKLVWIFVNSITLDPIEREVILTTNKNPFCTFMENLQNPEKQMEGAFAPSMKLVAGAGFEPTTFGL